MVTVTACEDVLSDVNLVTLILQAGVAARVLSLQSLSAAQFHV
jgi:hypothetical protein